MLRRMLNEKSLRIFPAMTDTQRAFIRRMIAVADGSRRAVPRSCLMSVRVPRRSR